MSGTSPSSYSSGGYASDEEWSASDVARQEPDSSPTDPAEAPRVRSFPTIQERKKSSRRTFQVVETGGEGLRSAGTCSCTSAAFERGGYGPCSAGGRGPRLGFLLGSNPHKLGGPSPETIPSPMGPRGASRPKRELRRARL